MCGRYALPRWTLEAIEAELEATWRTPTAATPRYNIAPTQHAPVVRLEDGRRVLDQLRWGLIPWWAKEPGIGSRLINARCETVVEKPAFRTAFRRRRCLVPAGGFYEWKATPGGKVPHWIHAAAGRPVVFAGLWESWRPDPEVEPVETFTILTADANPFMQSLHDRMPVMLEGDARNAWLDPDASAEELQGLMKPLAAEILSAHPVDRRVGNPRHDDEGLVEPLPDLELPLS